MGCGIQTGAGAVLNRLRPEFGSTTAVYGCGTVGMSAIMAAKIAGCQQIIAVGGNENSLKLAKELGCRSKKSFTEWEWSKLLNRYYRRWKLRQTISWLP